MYQVSLKHDCFREREIETNPQPVYFKIINESTGFVVEVFLSLMPLKEGHDLWCETANETESKEEQ